MNKFKLQIDGVLFKIVIDIVRYSSNIFFPICQRTFQNCKLKNFKLQIDV
jgi:hypothetical protein